MSHHLRISGTRGLVCLVIGLLAIGGCATTRNLVDFTGLGPPPVRIGVTQLELMPPPVLLPKRTLFQENLSFHLNEPVSFDLLTPRQIRVHLGTGRLRFAMLSPADFSEVAGTPGSRILAVPVNGNGDTYRQGLIIVSARSPLRDLRELKSLRFHFMPRGDVLNEVALAALLEAGISHADLDAGILRLGLDTHHISSLEVAKSVVMEEKVAGIIDEADYRKWKPTGGSLMLLNPSQDEVRVIARTVRVPEGPVLVSSQTSADLSDKVYDYLLNVLPQRKVILAAMGCRGFAAPIAMKEYEPFFAAHRRLYPEPPASQPLPGSEPAALLPTMRAPTRS